MTDHSALPYVDEHATTVAAEPSVVRIALLTTLDRTFSRPAAAAYARAVRCSPRDGLRAASPDGGLDRARLRGLRCG